MHCLLRGKQRFFLKKRLDVLLTEQGFFPSREKAKSTIMAGLVFVDGLLCDKAGTSFHEDVSIEIKGNACPYVSRGGLKLEKALQDFEIDLRGFVCLDIGASTGGFTDCMLQKGAAKVYAVDVGYGQLDWKLRTDERVVTMERVNFRYINPESIPDRFDFASIDVSFISLNLIFPVAKELMKPSGTLVCLVKPQFEAGRDQVGKKGIITDPEVHKSVLASVFQYAKNNDFALKNITYSPVKGAKGNIEYLMYLQASDVAPACEDIVGKIHDIVKDAHCRLQH